MTRETKIGLLVGLAFIIVIGILISDHVSSMNEPQTAPLPIAGNTVRAGLGEMGTSDDAAPLLRNPVAIAPMQRVPTHEELRKHSETQGVTLASPGSVNLNPPQSTLQSRQGNPLGEASTERLRKEALAHGEDIEPLDGNNPPAPARPTQPVKPALTQPPLRTVAAGYKAQSGDTLGSIAAKVLGANNKVNREAIVAANPSLQSNRNLVVAGRTYAVPTVTAGRSAAASPVTPVASETIDAPVHETNTTYVVQSGDTLWSIAVNELGSASEVEAIKDLNQDVLGDSEQLRPNMKLRLPGKKIAAAN